MKSPPLTWKEVCDNDDCKDNHDDCDCDTENDYNDDDEKDYDCCFD